MTMTSWRAHTVVADPPWPYAAGPKKNGFSSAHYRPMKDEAIKNFLRTSSPILEAGLDYDHLISDNAHLYLWTTCNFIPLSLQVCKSWGFRFVTLLTWDKPRGGMGRYFQTDTEHVIFGVRGKLKTAKLTSNRFEAPRTRHSEKPEAFYSLVESVSPGPYLELFARKARDGWRAIGDQL